MASKQDKILDNIIAIREDIGGIKQHLIGINGRLGKHDKSIEGLDTTCDTQDRRIDKIYVIFGTVGGALAIIFTIIQIIQKIGG